MWLSDTQLGFFPPLFSDYLDIVKDPISSGDYRKEEDPKLFQSEKTKRGPLEETWREEYTVANKVRT